MTKQPNDKDIFDWQTEDNGWEEQTAVSSHTNTSTPRNHPWMRIAILLFLIGAAIAYSQISRRVHKATETVADDLISTHQLFMQAAIEQDGELFSSLFQPDSRQFSQAQKALLMRGLFLDRSPLGIWFDYKAAESLDWAAISTQSLSPDLTEAEIEVALPYLIKDEAGELQSVTLRQTAVYQQDENGRWQLIPPKPQFWGEYEFEEQPYLKLVFPARDAEIGRRLAVDISPLLVQLCNSDEISCPDDLVIELYLSRNLERLAELDRDYQWDNSSLSSLIEHTILLYLPAPSLVGMPVDDDGYGALRRGYASLLAATMIHQFGADNGDRLPDQIQIQQQLATYQLALPSSLNTHPQRISEPPPIPFPDQNVILMCRNQFENNLYQYQIVENKWQTIPVLGGGISGMSALSNGDGALVTLSDPNGGGGSQLVWLQGARARVLAEDEHFISTYSSFMMPLLDKDRDDPLQHVVRYGVVTDNDFERYIGLLDEASCTDEACELQLIEQVPNYSPNGRFQLLSTEFTFASEIVLTDADGELVQSLGNGMSPQWLDDQTFTFVEIEEQADGMGFRETALITAVISPDGTLSQTRITIDDLLLALPDDAATEELFILGSSSIGEGQRLIYLYSIDEQSSLQYILQSTVKFGLNAQVEPTKLIEEFTDVDTAMILGVGPNGRFPYFAVNQSGEPDDTTLRLYDVEQDSWQTFSMSSVWGGSVTWSTDGNWLLLLEKDALHFVLPSHDYARHVFHDFQDCQTAVWVNQP